MTRIFTVALLLSASLAVAQKQKSEPDTGKTLSRQCSLALDVNFYHPRKIKNKREAYALGFCLGLIKGVYETGSGSGDFCPKDGVAARDIMDLTVRFVAEHPALQEKDPADIIRWALTDEYPCPEKDRSSENDSQAKVKQ